jgi:hypothetical protein
MCVAHEKCASQVCTIAGMKGNMWHTEGLGKKRCLIVQNIPDDLKQNNYQANLIK